MCKTIAHLYNARMKSDKIIVDHLKNNSTTSKGISSASVSQGKIKKNDKKLSREAWLKRKSLLRELRKALHEAYPTIFDYNEPKPLAIGIHKDIWQVFPQYSHKIIRLFLTTWVKDPRYLAAILKHPHRFNLEGMPIALIADVEKEYAQNLSTR